VRGRLASVSVGQFALLSGSGSVPPPRTGADSAAESGPIDHELLGVRPQEEASDAKIEVYEPDDI
jgi:hypothetical protein